MEDMGLGLSTTWRQNPMTTTLKHHMRKRSDVLLPQKRALPVRDLLQGTFKLHRDAKVVDALVFSLYFALFLIITYMAYDVHTAFTTDDAVIDLFLDEEFEGQVYKENFYEVMTHEKFWRWMRGPLVGGLYPDEWYNGDPLDRKHKSYLNYHLRLVGGAQLRQLRVANDSCYERRFVHATAVHGNQTLGRFDTLDGTCFSEWTSATGDTQPFGPASDPRKYTHSEGLSLLMGHHDFGVPYGTGGYVVELPTDGTAGSAAVEQLFQDRWTDRGTRAVAISFNLYNTNTRLLTVVRILFEFFPTGHMWKSAKTFTVKLGLYNALTDIVRGVLEVAYVGLLLYYMCRQFGEIRWYHSKLEFFFRFANLYDVVFLGANLMFITEWLAFVWATESIDFDVNATQYTDHFKMAERFIMAFTWAAGVGLLGFLKVFQFLGISKTMSALWMTLARAAPDLATFLVGFLVVSSGFAYTATLLFGPYLMEYHKLGTAFNTLLRVPLGDMDYDALAKARPQLAPVFFTLYVTMVALIILNMFIGIITKYFDNVHTELKGQDFWKNSTLSWEGEMMGRLRVRYLQWRCCRGGMLDARERKMQLSRHETRLKRRATYYAALKAAVRAAKRNNNTHLFEYFAALFEEANCASLYICVPELCGLIRSTPCSSHDLCEARKVHDTFVALNMVMLIGRSARKFVPLTAEESATFQTFDVLKFSSSGVVEPHILSIDERRGSLLNFNRHMRLQQRLPLKQLITAELDNNDPRRLIMMFSSYGLSLEEEKSLSGGGSLNMMYDVMFDDALNRHMFLSRLLEGHAVMNGRDPEDGVRVLQKDDDEGDAENARNARRASERASLMKVLTTQSSSRKSLLSTDEDVEEGGSAAADEAAGSGITKKTSRRLQAVERMRQEARELSKRIGQTASRTDLKLNSADLATLASMQQEMAAARRSLRQMGKESRRGSVVMPNGSNATLRAQLARKLAEEGAAGWPQA